MIIDMGVDNGIVRKSGAWFTYEGEQLGQGKEKARTYLIENKDTAEEIEQKILQKLGIGQYADVEWAASPEGADEEAIPTDF